MSQANLYFTSDWHIGHDNVLEFDNRPFRDMDHMCSVLVNNYNSIVGPTKTCYFLGDMGFYKSTLIKEIVSQLNGTKVLILGNHDKNRIAMEKLGFDVVMNGAILWIENKRVSLSHCPLTEVVRENIEGMRNALKGDCWHGESKHWNKFSFTPGESDFHLHGHIHSPNHGKSTRIQGSQMDVGVAANEYRPVSISQVESWITNHLKDRNV